MIRSILVLLAVGLFQINCKAQTSAVTGTGDEVILYDNHTWKYVNKTDTASSEIQTNRTIFEKKASSTFKVSSNVVNNAGIYLNPKVWSFKKGKVGASAEYTFQSLEKDAYAMLITERIQIPLTGLRDAAVENAIKVAPDVKVVKEEYRTVNGNQVLFMELGGTVEGIDVMYVGYYYSCERGSIQFVTYTSKNLMKSLEPDMMELLNGLVVKN